MGIRTNYVLREMWSKLLIMWQLRLVAVFAAWYLNAKIKCHQREGHMSIRDGAGPTLHNQYTITTTITHTHHSHAFNTLQ